MTFGLITIFARKEPTTDPIARKYLAPGYVATLSDVVFYKDKKCSEPYARWAHHCHPPRKGQKRVTLNCWQWAVEWVEMLDARLQHGARYGVGVGRSGNS